MASLYGTYCYSDYAFTYERADTRDAVPPLPGYNEGSVMWMLARDYPTMAYLARRSGLDGFLDSPQSSVTVFAPNEKAWKDFGVAEMDKNVAHGLVAYATLRGSYPSALLLTSAVQRLDTRLVGESLVCDSRTGRPVISGVPTGRLDTRATNGVIHEVVFPLVPVLFA